MAITFHSLAEQAEKEGTMPPAWKADRRLYLNADKTEAVEEGDPRAAYLLCTPGDEVPAADAKRYGLSEVTNAQLLVRFEAEGGDPETLGARPTKAALRAALQALRDAPSADPPEDPDPDPEG